MSTSSSLDKSVATELELERAPSTSSLPPPVPLPSPTPLAKTSTNKAPSVSQKFQEDRDTENKKPALKGEGKGEVKGETLLSASGVPTSSAGSVNKPSSSFGSSTRPPLPPSSTTRPPLETAVTDPSNGSADAGSPIRSVDVALLSLEEKMRIHQERLQQMSLMHGTHLRNLLADMEWMNRKLAQGARILARQPLWERLEAHDAILDTAKQVNNLTEVLSISSIPAHHLVAVTSDPSSTDTLSACCEVGGEICEERTGPMMLCGKCLAVAYCSKAHQKSDFQRHKLVCTEPNAYLRYCYEVRRPQVALPASTTTTSIDDVD